MAAQGCYRFELPYSGAAVFLWLVICWARDSFEPSMKPCHDVCPSSVYDKAIYRIQ